MRLIGKPKLQKLKKKKKGDKKLSKAINKLISDLEEFRSDDIDELRKIRPDADKVQSDGVFFFDISLHRTLIIIEIEDGDAEIIWSGSHDEYERVFKNDKKVIETWLRNKEYIE